MRQSKKTATTSSRSLNDALVDFVFEASEEDLDEALADNGDDPEEIAERAELAIDRAIARVSAAALVARTLDSPQDALHEGLSALLHQLMLRDSLNTPALARAVDVDAGEIERIRTDAAYRPGLRTLYRLENHFGLPPRSLGVLSGVVQRHSKELEVEATRFAAHTGKDPGKLSRHDRRALSEFIRVLAEHTDDEDET